MKTTIKEIARQLNLNPSTVSRALAGKPDVSPSTRQRVLELAQQMNYSPNLWAQNLVGTASNWIGCLVLDLSNPFYIPLVRSIENIADDHGFIIFLAESQRKLKNERVMIERFRRIKAAGVLVTPVMVDMDHLKVLQKDRVPVVVIGRTIPKYDCVNINNFHSGFLVGKYLTSLGHRRIGYVYSGDPYNPPEQDRLAGLKAALASSNLEVAWQAVVGNNELIGGEAGARQWIADPQRPSAVFCSNDMLAMGFISEALQVGISIPEDVSIVGHDDVPFAALFKIPLTTVTFSMTEMGTKAMQLLLARIAEKDCCEAPQTVLLEPEIVPRASSFAPRHPMG